jgi:uncharacterized damage-inducible protein DinB
MSDLSVEPWMRGPLPGIEPLVQPLFFSFTQVREDLARHTEGITQEQLWDRHGALPPLGFHLRHIAGSVERLTAYLMGEQLAPEQLAFLREESTPGATLGELLNAIDRTFEATQTKLRTIEPQTIHDPRYIGRKRLPTTVLGLLVHIAEHTQRHLGQAITTAKLARLSNSAL